MPANPGTCRFTIVHAFLFDASESRAVRAIGASHLGAVVWEEVKILGKWCFSNAAIPATTEQVSRMPISLQLSLGLSCNLLLRMFHGIDLHSAVDGSSGKSVYLPRDD
jgi:hypothetical protein